MPANIRRQAALVGIRRSCGLLCFWCAYFTSVASAEEATEVYRLPKELLPLRWLELSAGGKYVVAASGATRTGIPVTVHDVRAGKQTQSFSSGNWPHAYVKVSDDGAVVGSFYGIGRIRSTRGRDGASPRELEIPDCVDLVVAAAADAFAYKAQGGLYVRRGDSQASVRMIDDEAEGCSDAAISSDGKYVGAVASGAIKLFDASNGQLVFTAALPHARRGTLSLSDDGGVVTVGEVLESPEFQDIYTWNVREHRRLSQVRLDGPPTLAQVLSHDGRLLAVGGILNVQGWAVRVYDVGTGRLVRELKSDGFKNDELKPLYPVIAFDDSNEAIVFATMDGVVRRWSWKK